MDKEQLNLYSLSITIWIKDKHRRRDADNMISYRHCEFTAELFHKGNIVEDF